MALLLYLVMKQMDYYRHL